MRYCINFIIYVLILTSNIKIIMLSVTCTQQYHLHKHEFYYEFTCLHQTTFSFFKQMILLFKLAG